MLYLIELSIKGTTLLFTLLLTYTFSRVFYNIFLHPLRSFPGPLSARATILAFQRHIARGDSHLWLHKQHSKFGPVVRIAPNELSFISPQVWQDVYSHRASAFQKDMKLYGRDIFGEPGGMIRVDNVNHARQRRLVSHAFSDKALMAQEKLLKGYTELLARKLREAVEKSETEKGSGKVDIKDWYNFTTFDIMADLTFGEPLKLLEDSAYSPWVAAMFANMKMIALTSMLRQWPTIEALLNYFLPQGIKEKRRNHMNFTIDRVQKRLARKTDRPDIWTYILRHSESEDETKSLAPSEMHSDAGLFMTAGTETTATELSGMTYFLLKCPERMERLKKEIREAFATYEDMTMVKLGKLQYLDACINEGLRMYPPVPMGLPRVTPKGGAVVDGKLVPEGTSVQLPHYAAYHSKSHFKNPDTFIPERWLPEGQDEYGSDCKEILQPFSYGPRNCVGKNLARHEMRLIMATVLWHFDVEFCDESEGWPNQKFYILWEKEPLMVKLRPIR